MPVPTVEAVQAYLADTGGSWSADQVGEAYAAEKAAQALRCSVPADDAVWPADLAEALKRRVAHNLAVRAIPLGVQPNFDGVGGATRVGGTDAEVRRLEKPYRKRGGVG